MKGFNNKFSHIFPILLYIVNSVTSETNFFLMNIPLNTGEQSSVVFFTNQSSKLPVPLCLTENYDTSITNILAQQVCTFSKFPTFLTTSWVKPSAAVNISQESYSKMICYYGFDHSIVCSRSSSIPSPCSLLHVTCGPCHHNLILQPDSTIQVKSPLYPVFQPGLMCQYDFHLAQGVIADISLEFTDLSLNLARSSPSGQQQRCSDSFVQILSGDSFSDMRSVATLCGDLVDSREMDAFEIRNNIVRIVLVAGSGTHLSSRRGFIANITVPPASFKLNGFKLVILITFFAILILIGVVLASFISYHYLKPRLGPTNRQAVQELGHSRNSPHISRTEILTFDDWVRTLPGLPNFDFASDDEASDVEDPGFKVYETLSDIQRSCQGSISISKDLDLGDDSIFHPYVTTPSRTCFREGPVTPAIYGPFYMECDDSGMKPTCGTFMEHKSIIISGQKPKSSRTSIPLSSISNIIKCMSGNKCGEEEVLLDQTEEGSDDEVFFDSMTQ